MTSRLMESFFARDTIQVARDLIGKKLVRLEGKKRIAGLILETEAYRGEEDLACHCRAGRTPRTEIMYGLPGRSYVYFIYGMYWLLNIVTEKNGFPGAVLIRAIYPLAGQEIVAHRRKVQPQRKWTDGPGKICLALNIDGELNGINTCGSSSPLYIEEGQKIAPEIIQAGPRVGLESVPEPWRSIPWRFMVNYQHLKALT